MGGRLRGLHGRSNGLRALALQGLCKPLWSERSVAEKSPIQVDQTLRLPQPHNLPYGDALPDAKVAFRLVGPDDAPVLAVLGGISARRVVARPGGDRGWAELVGPGLGVEPGG